jgi:hypothetical protein
MRGRSKSLLAWCALVLSLAAVGCGSGTSTQSLSTKAQDQSTGLPARDGDHDIDSLGQGRYDIDNDANPTFGPAADSADRRTIVALITHYYALAAARDGGQACSLLDPLVIEALVEEHAGGGGASVSHGGTCSEIATKVFTLHHRELAEDVADMRVAWVQLQARQAVALVRFGATRERIVRTRRAHGRWQMYALLDNGPL